jgi:hypothetical protein
MLICTFVMQILNSLLYMGLAILSFKTHLQVSNILVNQSLQESKIATIYNFKNYYIMIARL